jgi:hypothetical protein
MLHYFGKIVRGKVIAAYDVLHKPTELEAHIIVAQRNQSSATPSELVCFHDVFCDFGSPLVFDSKTAVTVTEILQQSIEVY